MQTGSNQDETGGLGLGAGIFIQGNQTILFAPALGDSLTVANVIADQTGSGGTGNSSGNGNVEIGGPGVVHFTAANTYYGVTIIRAGATLDVDGGGTVGTNVVTVLGTLNLNAGGAFGDVMNVNGTLNVNAATTFSQAVTESGTMNVSAASTFSAGLSTTRDHAQHQWHRHFRLVVRQRHAHLRRRLHHDRAVHRRPAFHHDQWVCRGDTIDLRGVAATGLLLGANNVLTLKNSGGTPVGTLNFDPTQTFDLQFGVLSDSHGGTIVDLIQTAFPVASATDLNTALAAVSQGGADFSLASTAYTVTFTGNISLPSSFGGQLATINLNTGSTLLIDGAGFTLDGANTHLGFTDNSAGVTLKDLSVANTPGYGILVEGNHSLTLSASSGHVSTIAGVIADGGAGNTGSVVIGGGSVTFTAANTYTGGTTVTSGATLEVFSGGSVSGTTTVNSGGTLDLAGGSVKAVVDNGNIEIASRAAVIGGAVTGSGHITFSVPDAVLKIASGVPTTTFFGMADGDVIDLGGITAASISSLGGNNYALLSSGGATLGTLHFDPSQNLALDAPILVADGTGGTNVRLHDIPVFTASTAAQLAALIAEIDVGGVYSLANTSYEIDLTGPIALTANLPAINLASGDTLSIVGNGNTVSGALNGAATYAAFNLQSGSLSLSNLTISHTSNDYGSGLGVWSGTSATLSNVIFSDNHAPGRVGGAIVVVSGSSLTLGAGSFSGDTADLGAAIWLDGSSTITFAPPTGQTLTVANSIGGGNGTINISGPGDVTLSGGFDSGSQAINISGPGNVTLSGAFFGSQTVTDTGSGTLTVKPFYNVGSASDLAGAAFAIDGDAIGLLGGINYVINLTADVAASGGIPAIHLDAGDTLTIETNGHLFDGATNGAGGNFTYAATGPGGSTVLTGGAVPTFNVASATDLANVVTTIDNFLSSASTDYVINLTADVPATAGLPLIALASGSTLTVDTNGHLYDGATNGAGTNFVFAATGPGGSTTLIDGCDTDFQRWLAGHAHGRAQHHRCRQLLFIFQYSLRHQPDRRRARYRGAAGS